MARPLFIIGNKRSGTSQLVRVLNLHPGIFISHESDVAWILFQFHHDRPFHAHPWDSDRGMRLTLQLAGSLLRRDASPRDNFLAVQTAIMEHGTPWLPAQAKTGLRWIGDKKPMQHTDPEVLAFLRTHFPEARFLHLIRHPFDVVASSDRFNQTADGDFWLGLSPEEKMERWGFHEAQVLQWREAMPGRVHTLRYEDFCRRTAAELLRLWAFLELPADPNVLRAAARQTRPNARPVRAVHCSRETARIAAAYDYDLRRRSGLRAWAENTYWRTTKMLAH